MENYSDMHASLIRNFESILEINASLEQVHVRINNMEKQIASILRIVITLGHTLRRCMI